MTTEREAFEAWVAECHAGWNMKKSPRGHYLYTEAHTGWSAWQAACAWQREKDAGICAQFSHEAYAQYKYTGRDYDDGKCDAANALCDKIRSPE